MRELPPRALEPGPPGPFRAVQQLQICAKNAKFLFFSVVVESCALSEVSEVGCRQSLRDVSHVQPVLRTRLAVPRG